MRRRILGDRRRGETGLPYNTMIGNLADVYPTAESLGNKLWGVNYEVGDITYYNTVGNDIEAKIVKPYSIYFYLSPVTYWIETEPMCFGVATNGLRNCQLLHTVKLLEEDISIGDYAFGSFSSYQIKEIILPNITAVTANAAFAQLYNTELWIPKALQLGPTTGYDLSFFGSPRNYYTVHANVALQTSNGGNIEGDLQWLIDRGHTVNFVTEYSE